MKKRILALFLSFVLTFSSVQLTSAQGNSADTSVQPEVSVTETEIPRTEALETQPTDTDITDTELTDTPPAEETASEESGVSEPEPAAEGEEEDPVQEDFVIEDGVLIEYRGTEQHVTIPDGVTTLSHTAFQNNPTVVSVVIPNSVTEIQSHALQGCPLLEEVTLPNNLQKTDSFVFDQCPKLKRIIFAEGTQEINASRNFFYGCAVEEIVLPESVKKIGDYAFSEVDTLNKINLPDSITEIGEWAFYRCNGLTSIELPENLEILGNNAFAECGNLIEVYIPQNGSIKKIGDYAFSEIASLKEINLPDSIIEIGEGAFFRCNGLTNIELPENLEILGGNAFGECANLTEVYIPKKITKSGSYVDYVDGTMIGMSPPFFSCTALKTVRFAEDVDKINEFLFSDTGLEEITLPSGITTIQWWAFSSCLLKRISIPEGVTTIDKMAFFACDELSEVILPSTLTSIGYGAFQSCTSLKKITIPSSVTSIESGAFEQGITIICEEGSAAHRYAEESGMNFVLTGEHEHDFGPWQVTQEPTCTAPGAEVRTCSCGYEETRPINPLSHDFSEEWTTDKEPTCTEEGERSRHCSRCDERTDIESIDKLPHTYGEWQTVKEAGCTTTGTEERKCVCGDTQTRDKAPLGHDFSEEWTTDKEPTCTEEGQRSRHCSRCDERTDIESIDKLPHTYGEWQTVKEAGCTTTGTEERKCVCGDTQTRDIPLLGHDYGEWITDTPSTYYTEGKQHRTCSRCNDTEEAAIPILQPDFESHPDYSLAEFTVVDALNPDTKISGAAITVTGPEGSWQTVTEKLGRAKVFVPQGTYTILVEKGGYQPRSFQYELTSGTLTLPQIGISEKSVVNGQLSVTEMTQEEIEEAGIDTSAPGNQQIWKYKVTVTFKDGIEQYELPFFIFKNENGNTVKTEKDEEKDEDVPGEDSGDDEDTGSQSQTYHITGSDGSKFQVCMVNEYMYLVIKGSVKWQKEMFHAQLLVINTSNTDQLENCVASLTLPQGLSLADMTEGQQEAKVSLGTINTGGDSKTVDWYIRGDEKGDYNISAALTGNFSLGDSFQYIFQTAEPLHVYAGSDMQLTVHLSDAAYYGKPYTMLFELENVSDHPIYNVKHQVKSVTQYQVKEYVWLGSDEETPPDFSKLDDPQKLGEDGIIEKDVFEPGEKLCVLVNTDVLWRSPLERLKQNIKDANTLLKVFGIAKTTPGFAVSTLFTFLSMIDIRYSVDETMVSTLEGSTAEIPVVFDVEEHGGVSIIDKAVNEALGLGYDTAKKHVLQYFLEDSYSGFSTGSTLFKSMKDHLEIWTKDDNTECVAWVEAEDGSSNVISISSEGASTDSEGRLIFQGNAEISVEALNTGEAYLVVQDESGAITRKKFTVQEMFPGQEHIVGDVEDMIDMGYVLAGPGAVLAKDYQELLDLLDMEITNDGAPLKEGDPIPNGAVIKDRTTGETIQVLVPGDTNQDAEVNLFDSYKIIDSDPSSLSALDKTAGNFTGDDTVDQGDAAYLLSFLTRSDINYAINALSLSNAGSGADESQLVQKISLGELTEGIDHIRGIQLDIFNLSENGISTSSTAGNADTDFVNSVYSTDGDYVRMIAADYEGYSSFKDSSLTVRYRCDTEKRLKGKLYIQTDSESIVKDVEFVFDGQEQNPETEFSGKAVIDVSYLADGQEVDPEKLEAGSAFQIQVTVKNTASEALPGNVYFTIRETLDGLPQKLCTILENPWCNGDINNGGQVQSFLARDLGPDETQTFLIDCSIPENAGNKIIGLELAVSEEVSGIIYGSKTLAFTVPISAENPAGPDTDRPGTGTDNPDTDQPGTDPNNPDTDQPGTDPNNPGTDQPGADPDDPDTDQPGADPDNPDTDQPGTDPDDPDTDQPGAGTDNPDTDQPNADPGTSDTNQPGTSTGNPDTDKTGTSVEKNQTSDKESSKSISGKAVDNSSNKENGTSTDKKSVATGDNTDFISPVLLFSLSLAAVLLCLKKRKHN